MRKISVLQFPVRNLGGGITQYALNNWEWIDKSRFQFGFATLSKSLDFEDRLAAQGCGIHHISCSAEENEKQFTSEFENILSRGYDAVHLHTSYWKSFACEEAAKKIGIPVVIVHAHNTGPGAIADRESMAKAVGWHEKQKQRFNPALATRYCACSRRAADWLFGPQIDRGSIHILNNAIDTSRFAYNPSVREQYRRKMDLGGNFVIGHVGRFEYQKNHDFLMDVFAEVSGKLPKAKLMLIGVGAGFDAIRAKAESLGIADRVLFLGKRSDVAELYQAMDVFVLPSHYEGVGIVLVEAQSSGVKCISSSSSSMPENVITDNIIDLPFKISLWRDSILEIANTGYERRDRSGEVASAGYSLKEQIKILERIYSCKQ